MGYKKEKKIARMVVAQELARLSGQVADGFLEIDSSRVELPDEFFYGKSLKIKKSESDFEFILKIKADRRQKRPASTSQVPLKRKRSRKSSYKAKKLKKEIGIMWKALKRCIKSGESFRDREGLLDALDIYGKSADEKWASEWKECVEMVKKAIELTDQDMQDKALEICEQVDKMMRSCHKRFK